MDDLMVWDDGSGHQHAEDTQIYNSTSRLLERQGGCPVPESGSCRGPGWAPQASAKPRKVFGLSGPWVGVWPQTNPGARSGDSPLDSQFMLKEQLAAGARMTFAHFWVVCQLHPFLGWGGLAHSLSCPDNLTPGPLQYALHGAGPEQHSGASAGAEWGSTW